MNTTAVLHMVAGLSLVFSDSRNSERYIEQGQNIEFTTTIKSLTTPTSTRFNSRKRFSIEQLLLNKQKLESFRNLAAGWNGYQGDKINTSVISKVMDLLPDLEFQPQIFPTGRGSIQIEKYVDERNLIEIEVFEDEVSVYQVKDGKELEKDVPFDEVKNIISNFYA